MSGGRTTRRRSEAAAIARTVTIERCRDGVIARESPLAHFRQSPAHGTALLIAQPVRAEMSGFDVSNRSDEFVLSLLRPSQDALQQYFKSPSGHGDRIAESGFSVIASEAKQSRAAHAEGLDCLVALLLAMTVL
jgi:hypothetical protein